MKDILFKITSLVLILFSLQMSAQEKDSLNTGFRKGRWLTGLSGTISSTTTEVKTPGIKSTSNNFGINIETGKFIKTCFLLGGKFLANKSSSSGTVDSTTETFYIGPFTNYYLNKSSSTGSLFATVSIGYVRYKNETLLQAIEVSNEGGGLGAVLGVGYSYTFNDFVAFDLGINTNLFWVNVDQESSSNQNVTNTSINSYDIVFSFGFNVILDDFFF